VTNDFRRAFDEGREAHEDHQTRRKNPYLGLAIGWDRGWVQRQIEQLRSSSRHADVHKIRSFAEFLGLRRRDGG